MVIDPGRVKALFQAAIEQDDPARRRAFLDREIAGDPELGERIEALLAAHDRPTGPLDRPLDAGLPGTVDIPGEHTRSYRKPGSSTVLETVIAGRYKIRQEIGEGGMGSVYLAEQTQPVKRMVALKLI
jgi:hypothetical protein